jgi:hypothetical protein
MPLSTNSPNHFLLSLSDTDRNLIFPHLKRVTVPRETIIFKAEDTIERVYFPHSGIVSLVVGLSSGQFVEAGMLGRNGVIGAGAALDGQTALNTAIGQADGAGTMIEAGVLKKAARESETLRVALVYAAKDIRGHRNGCATHGSKIGQIGAVTVKDGRTVGEMKIVQRHTTCSH